MVQETEEIWTKHYLIDLTEKAPKKTRKILEPIICELENNFKQSGSTTFKIRRYGRLKIKDEELFPRRHPSYTYTRFIQV